MKEVHTRRSRLKILIISYLFPNSVYPNHGIFVSNRIRALSRYVDVKIINPIPCSPIHRYIDRYKDYINIPFTEIIHGLEVYHPRYFSIPRYFKGLEKYTYSYAVSSVYKNISKEGDFDLVDMHWTFPDLPAGLKIAVKNNIPSIVTLRGMEALHLNENTARSNLVRDGLQKVDKIIALSNELKKQADILSCSNNKSMVIINGVDNDKFYYIPMDISRDELGIDRHEQFVLSVGSLIKRKGFETLIKMIKELQKKQIFNNIKLYIIGSEGAEGDYRKELFNLIHRLNLEESVVFVGQVQNSDLKYWYNSCDIFCLASHGEGSPNVLSEALACGCPVVSSDVGSARDIIDLQKNSGICLDKNTVNSFSEAVTKSFIIEKSRENRSLKYQQYDWDWCARNVLEVYNQCTRK